MVRLRKAGVADLESFFELDQVCFPAEIAYPRNEFRILLSSAKAIGVAAEEDGILAGFAIAQSGRLRRIAIGNIVTLDVDPAFRRRGIGRLLMHHLEREMARAGAACLRLEVAVDNPGAQSFYARLGFEPIGQIRGYYHANLDAIVMEKPLPAASL